MKIVALIIGLTLSSAVSMYAQSQLQKGVLITKRGDTLEGWIQYTSLQNLCHQVKFTEDKTQKLISYTGQQIDAFEVKGLNRQFLKVEIDRLKADFDPQRLNPQDSVIIAFAECLVQTQSHSLYLYQNRSGKKRFFVKTANGLWKELVLEIIQSSSGGGYQQKNKKYIGLLKLLFKDCTTISEEYYAKLNLNIENISEVFIKYANDTKQVILHQSPLCTEKGSSLITLGVGIGYANTVYTPIPNYPLKTFIPEQIGTVAASCELQWLYYPPFLRQVLFVGFSGGYHKVGTYSPYGTTFDQHYGHLGGILGYQYPFGKVKPYLGIKITTGWLFNRPTAFLPSSNAPSREFGRTYINGRYEYNDAFEFAFHLFAGVDIPLGKQNHLRLGVNYLYGRMPFLGQALSSIYGNQSIEFQVQFGFNLKSKS